MKLTNDAFSPMYPPKQESRHGTRVGRTCFRVSVESLRPWRIQTARPGGRSPPRRHYAFGRHRAGHSRDGGYCSRGDICRLRDELNPSSVINSGLGFHTKHDLFLHFSISFCFLLFLTMGQPLQFLRKLNVHPDNRQLWKNLCGRLWCRYGTYILIVPSIRADALR